MKLTHTPHRLNKAMMTGLLCLLVASAAAAEIDLGGKVHLSQAELKIWNDAGFQKRFAESYIAETEIEPRVTMEQRKVMQKVLALISADQMDEAAGELQRAGSDVGSAVFDFTLANIYFQQDKLDRAAESYLAAVSKYAKFRRAWKNLGLIYIRQGEFAKALAALTRVLKLGGSDALTYGLLGYAYGSVEDSLAAESAYRMAVLMDPKTMDWKMGLVRSLFRQQRYAEAAAMCGVLIRKNPEQADLWLLQANAYIGQGKAMKAAENYELVDRLGKSTADSLNMLGDIYVNEELFDLAVDSYLRAMAKDPSATAERPLRAAQVLVARGALSETKALLEKLENVRGDQLSEAQRKDVLKLRARIAVAEGSGEDEVKVLEKIVQLDPLDGEALILLGQHSARSGDTEKAIFYYERAENLETFEADAKVRHAQVLVGEGKYNEALPLLNRAQQIKPRENIQKYIEQIQRVARQN